MTVYCLLPKSIYCRLYYRPLYANEEICRKFEVFDVIKIQ